MEATTPKQHGDQPENYVSWFEIPVLNLNRAMTFYNQIFDIEMEQTEAKSYTMAFFPTDQGVGGALIMGPGCVPSETGPLVYLNAGDRLEEILTKIEIHGGRIIMGKTEIVGDGGHFALFIDSEGNKLALHSKSPEGPDPAEPIQLPEEEETDPTEEEKVEPPDEEEGKPAEKDEGKSASKKAIRYKGDEEETL